MRTTCDTKWSHHSGCLRRAVASAAPYQTAMFFSICPSRTTADQDTRWALMVSTSDHKTAHTAFFKTVNSAKRAAADYVRGFRRYR